LDISRRGKRRTVIILSYPNQPFGCSFLQQTLLDRLMHLTLSRLWKAGHCS